MVTKRVYVYSSSEAIRTERQRPLIFAGFNLFFSICGHIVQDIAQSFSPAVLRQTALELATLGKPPGQPGIGEKTATQQAKTHLENLVQPESKPKSEPKLQLSGVVYLSPTAVLDHAEPWKVISAHRQKHQTSKHISSAPALTPLDDLALTLWVQKKKLELVSKKTWYRVEHTATPYLETTKELFEPLQVVFARIPPRLAYSVGSVMVGIALFSTIFFGAPFFALELRSLVFRVTSPLIPTADPNTKPTVFSEVSTPEQNKQFSIRIPMIGVDSQVTSNVDMNNPKEYEEALKHGVAHAKGTGLPGDDGGINKTIVIFSHSTNGSWNITKYNALFYSLKDLKEEDQIQVWFWGKEYWYKVKEKKVIEPNDVSFLEPQMDTEKLILQTCWPPGTISKRLLIVAERVQN